MSRKSTKAAAEGRHVAVYCRISRDRTGRVEGVRNQERWGRAYAARQWPGVPVVVYADNDVSAFDDEAVRPEYERLREAIRRSEVAHVWAVEQSRLERREIEWFKLAAELDAAGITEVHTNRDGIVRIFDEVSGIKAVLNAAEVRRLRRRILDALEEQAARGIPNGNGRIYGYTRGVNEHGDRTLHIVDDEAAVIREAADLVLAGWSLTSISREMNRRGVTGPRTARDGGPSPVTPSLVKRWLTTPTVAGMRVHRGEIIGRGNWPPILDEETWRAVRAALASPRVVRRVSAEGEQIGEYPVRHIGRRPVRNHLLTNVVVCGRCGASLTGSRKHIYKHGRVTATRDYYWCRTGCVSAPADPIEQHVVATLLDELAKPEFLAAMASDTHAEERDRITRELAAIDAQRVELAKLWARRELAADEWAAARQALQDDEARLRRELATLPAPLHRIDPAAVREGWDAMTLEEQREIVTMFIDTIAIAPAPHRGAQFTVDRIAPPETWWR